MTPQYRPDIDGLRAIAVMSVVLFHSGFNNFSGGYVGVDIFFVISGYLITTIIVKEITNDNFTISGFYERRFRRILPALIVVTLFAVVVGFLLLTPKNFLELGKSVVATAIFSSNILFYSESGYFDGAAEMKPLLHTWSLAVEEQYYIFFPLLLVLIAKYGKKNYLIWLISLGAFSLSYCLILTEQNPTAAFYLFHARAWELFIGSILALNVLPKLKIRVYQEMLSIIGMAMIAYSVFFFTSETNFPGYAALVPTVGTALIIYTGISGNSFVITALSFRPMVFIGLISYSLYLWHWPIIVYTKLFSIIELDYKEKYLMLMVMFVFAYFSWRYIETPFRKKSILKEKRNLLCVSLILSLVIVVVGVVIVYEQGLPARAKYEPVYVADFNDKKWMKWNLCKNVIKRLRNDRELCQIGSGNNKESFMLWGDSHAMAISSGLEASVKKYDVKGFLAFENACAPLLDVGRRDRNHCEQFNNLVIEHIKNSPEIETVILAARWALVASGERYKEEAGRRVRLISNDAAEFNADSNQHLFEIGLKKTVKKLYELDKRVVLVNQVPEIGYDVPSAAFVALNRGLDVSSLIAPNKREYEERNQIVNNVFSNLRAIYPVTIISAENVLCDDHICDVIANGNLLYRDDDHLSTFGSEFITQVFDEVFKEDKLMLEQ